MEQLFRDAIDGAFSEIAITDEQDVPGVIVRYIRERFRIYQSNPGIQLPTLLVEFIGKDP